VARIASILKSGSRQVWEWLANNGLHRTDTPLASRQPAKPTVSRVGVRGCMKATLRVGFIQNIGVLKNWTRAPSSPEVSLTFCCLDI